LTLREWLKAKAERAGDGYRNRQSGRRLRAMVPMHTFGHPVRLDEIAAICLEWGIPLVEDAAESLGSRYKGRHTGTFGQVGVFSFNGNKILTTGGGGMVVTNDDQLAANVRHLSTTAKVPHRWEYIHDQVGYNYRMPNINAGLGLAQLEQLPKFLESKRALARYYADLFSDSGLHFIQGPPSNTPNYWLCSVLFENDTQRERFLELTNDAGIMTRPAWEPLHKLDPYQSALTGDLDVTLDIASRLVNIPSSVR
jgi:dTDP-4-amino-4,6-dideoxygalactose transaminase